MNEENSFVLWADLSASTRPLVPTLKQKNNERVGLTNDLHGLAEELIRRSVDELQQ
jgi:hypothetical protein